MKPKIFTCDSFSVRLDKIISINQYCGRHSQYNFGVRFDIQSDGAQTLECSSAERKELVKAWTEYIESEE